jgi:hypothetical protein
MCVARTPEQMAQIGNGAIFLGGMTRMQTQGSKGQDLIDFGQAVNQTTTNRQTQNFQVSPTNSITYSPLITTTPVQSYSQPQSNDTYVSRATPKFNFRSSPFSIQQEQAGSESGLNLG